MDTRARNILKLIEDELSEQDSPQQGFGDPAHVSDAARALVKRLAAKSGIRPVIIDYRREPGEA